MRLEPEQLKPVQVLTAKTFPDERGFLLQAWVKADLEAAGIPSTFKQAIQTVSKRGVVRGLHFQWNPAMGKYVRCIRGAIIDVVVDIRPGSKTFGDHVAVELNERNHKVIWVPIGFAHGTFALEDQTIVFYECTASHAVGNEGGILWNDPALGIAWPDIPPIVSDKDKITPTLAQWQQDPRFKSITFD
jgi:dTDP-4-dehydrorhamnose 3,5-epimerase